MAKDIEKIIEEKLSSIFANSSSSLDVLNAAKQYKLHQVLVLSFGKIYLLLKII